jgi:uncharacterized protein (DUF2147 family)
MKIRSLLIVLMGLVIYPFAQISAQEVKADDILGVWLNEDKDAHVEIYKDGDKYFGKIIWLKNPIREETGKPKLDKENEDESLRTRPVMGMLLLSDFEFDGDDEWEDGTIYDPKNGKTYKCYMEFEDEDNLNTLKVRGFIGFSLLGRTTYWTKVK